MSKTLLSIFYPLKNKTMSQFPFVLPDEQKKELERIAKERHCSIAQVIRDAIQKYIEEVR